jgi:hypothetical protein
MRFNGADKSQFWHLTWYCKKWSEPTTFSCIW